MGPEPHDPGAADSPSSSDQLSTPSSRVKLSPASLPLAGERYRPEDLIGRGGMGEVHSVRDRRIGRRVAMKQLRPDCIDDADLTRRFLREAQVQGQLEHPAIVPLYELGQADADGRAVPYFTMKRVKGSTLREVLDALRSNVPGAAERHTRHRLLTAFVTVARAIAYAHAHGVIHRDLKPHNIMLGDFGEVYVLDWGVAKVEGHDDITLSDGAAPIADETAVGRIMGTAGYMAPEQLRGEPIDKRVDVYALGTILFEVLTLEMLNDGAGPEQRTAATLQGRDVVKTALAIDPDLAPELVTICARASALDRDDRYASVAGLIARLEQFLDGDRDATLRRSLSRAHSDRAAAALEGAGDGDELAQRRSALNQLGRALALDAENRDAMKLLVRLLTEAPKAMPAEVAESLDRDEERSVTRAARVGTWLFASLIGFVPVAMWMGVRSWTMVGGIVVLVLWCLGALAATGRWWPANQQGLYPAYVASSMTIAGIATLFGPLVVVPGMAAVNTVTFLMQFRRVRWWPVVVGCASFLVPLGLQQLGILRPSYLFARGRIELVPWALDMTRVPSLTFLTLSAVAVLVTGAVMTMNFRRALNEANVQTRLHNWHLRHLVPAAEPQHTIRAAAGASDTLSPRRRPRSG